jgi:hypothetical protein
LLHSTSFDFIEIELLGALESDRVQCGSVLPRITKIDDRAVSRERTRETFKYGAGGGKALLYGGPLGLAVVKSKRMNNAMQKQWDAAAKSDGDMKARIQAGKKTTEDKFAALMSVSVLDIAGANKRVNTTGPIGKKNRAPRD